MQGGKHKQPLGYSVIETMIFMAVSGLMFVISAAFINGKTADVEYRQSVTEINAQLRSVVNDVSDGQYDNLGTNRCFAPDGAGTPSFSGVGGSGQGTNGGRSSGLSGCVFVGKVIHFGVDRNPSQYALYTIIGRQTKPASDDTVQSFAQSQPIVADDGSASLTQVRTLQNAMTFTSAWLCTKDCSGPPAATPVGTFGIFGSFGGFQGSSTSNESGSQKVITKIIPGTDFPIGSPSNDQAAMGPNLESKLHLLDAPTSNVSDGKFILLCFEYNGRKGSVTLGGANGQSFTTEPQIGQETNPRC